MVKYVKVILFLLFAFILNGLANDFSAEKTVESQKHALTYQTDSQELCNAQLPYLPEGELTAPQTHQVVTNRIQRLCLLEYSVTIKGLVQSLVSRESALVQHLGKIYDTTTAYNCHPSSEYYVFALRRIII